MRRDRGWVPGAWWAVGVAGVGFYRESLVGGEQEISPSALWVWLNNSFVGLQKLRVTAQ